MFISVSWQEYFIGVILFLIIYYGIWILYFRKYPTSESPGTTINPTVNKEMTAEEKQHEVLFSAAQELMAAIKKTFEKAAAHNYKKEGLLMALQGNLVKYKKLKGTAFQVSINNHIIKASEQMSILVEENDLKNMW